MSDLKIQAPSGFEPLLAPSAPATTKADAAGVDFGELVKQSIDSVNEAQASAAGLATRFETGDESVDLVRVMVEMQKARVGFEAVSQVRNKLVEAYREIMNMQV